MLGFLRTWLRRWSRRETGYVHVGVRDTEIPGHPTLAVGDVVMHPIRHEPTPVLAIGTRVWQFVADEEHAKPDAVVHEVLEGSPEFRLLRSMRSMYRGAFMRKEWSVEIDFTHDIERKTLVVPMASLKKITADELEVHDRKRIARTPEAGELVELPDVLTVARDKENAPRGGERSHEQVVLVGSART